MLIIVFEVKLGNKFGQRTQIQQNEIAKNYRSSSIVHKNQNLCVSQLV